MDDERLVTAVGDVLALARHLGSIHRWPFVEPLDSEGTLFSIRWTSHNMNGGYETVIVGPKSGLVFENGGPQERSTQLTGERAFDKLTEMRALFERVAVDAEVRLMETQAQRERTEQARKNVYEKLALSAPRGYR